MKFVKPLILSLFIASPAVALAPLHDVKEIDDQMMAIAIAIEVSDKCGSIAPRTLKGLGFLWSLKDKASKMGYSDDEIRNYVDSDAEQARMRQKAYAYARNAGFDPTKASGLCALGKSEIAKGSLIGSFLRLK